MVHTQMPSSTARWGGPWRRHFDKKMTLDKLVHRTKDREDADAGNAGPSGKRNWRHWGWVSKDKSSKSRAEKNTIMATWFKGGEWRKQSEGEANEWILGLALPWTTSIQRSSGLLSQQRGKSGKGWGEKASRRRQRRRKEKTEGERREENRDEALHILQRMFRHVWRSHEPSKGYLSVPEYFSHLPK